MSDTLRSQTIRLAASLPKGSPKRIALLDVLALNKTAASLKDMKDELSFALEEAGLGPSDVQKIQGWSFWLKGSRGEVVIYENPTRDVLINYKGKEYKSVRELMKLMK